jgi:hypothetical protein
VSNYKNVIGGVLESALSKGDITMNFQLADLTPDVIAEFCGGVVTSAVDADSYDAPANMNQSIEKSIMFLTEKNIVFRIARCSVDAFPIINDDDLHYYQINAVVLQPEKEDTSMYGYDILKDPDAYDIITFTIPNQTGASVISAITHTVAVTMPSGTSPTALVPTIGTSKGCSITPGSGVATDFTAPVTYTVLSANGTEQDWVVTVTITP